MAKVIYDYYKGEDLYSDAEVEDELIDYFSGNESKEYSDSLLFFYHTSEMRKGLLNWYNFKPNSTVIEIGAGCGALTGMLCEKCEKVIAIELSSKRAEINSLRNKDKDNLEIYVANISDLEGIVKADYIVVVGVLEYQESYIDADNPYLTFLSNLKKYLKADGKLLLAIENRFGIKYWCGAPEDHTRIPYDGISNYRNGGKARTFTKNELEALLDNAGFKNRYFYYPMPDYRIVEEVYSDDYMPQNAWGLGTTPYYGEYMDSLMAIEKTQYKDLFRNGVFGVFANSFLVEAGLTENRCCDVIYAKSNYDRKKEYRICTTIGRDRAVKKIPIEKEAVKTLEHCVEAANKINSLNLPQIEAVSVEYKNGYLESPFVEYPCLLNRMLEAIENKSYLIFDHLLNTYYSCILASAKVVSKSEKYGEIMEQLYIEMTPSNCFIDENDKIYVFDIEESWKNKPANFMVFRTIEYLEGLNELFSWGFRFEKYKEEYGVKEVWYEYEKELQDYYSSIKTSGSIPLERAQIIDIERMGLNAEFISYLGMKSLKEIDRLNNALDEVVLREARRTKIIIDKYSQDKTSVEERFKRFWKEHMNKADCKLILWGTGECFKRNIELLKALGDVQYLCDSNSDNWNRSIEGIQCLPFKDISQLQSRDVAIIIMIDDLRASFDVSMKIQQESDLRSFHITSVLKYLEE